MLVARLGFGSLLLVLLTCVACSESRVARVDAGSSARDASHSQDANDANARDASQDAGEPLEISASDCARTNLGQGWKLPVLANLLGCRTHADCGPQPYASCIGYPQMRCDYASGPGRFHELCSSDSDCTNDVGGYCTEALEATQCVFHECVTDADCGVDEACLCSDGVGRNYCVVDGCHGDDDCGAGQRCRRDSSIPGVPPQWHCQTPNDACREDSDCPGGGEDSLAGFCGYNTALHHWECVGLTVID